VPLKTGPVIAVVGGANMDIYAHASAALRAGDSTPGRVQCAPGGVGRNIAENLVRLGHAVQLFSAVGDDLFGRSLLDAGLRMGLDMQHMRVVPGANTASYLSVHSPDGDTAAAVNDMTVLDVLDAAALQQKREALDAAAMWVLDTNLSRAALAWLMENAQGKPVVAEAVSVAKCVKLLPYLNHLYLLKLNGMEAEALSHTPVTTVEQALRAAQTLQAHGVQQVVVSLGAQGAVWADAMGCGHIVATPVSVVNTAGAGDALLSGVVHGIALGHSLATGVRMGMACAARTLGVPFANCPDLCTDDLELTTNLT
jgi:pseudouridine kinase